MKELKVGILIVFYTALLILITVSTVTPYWVYSNYNLSVYYTFSQSLIIDLERFEGGLLSCINGCSLAQEYKDIIEIACKPDLVYYDNSYLIDICNSFKYLFLAGMVKFVSDIVSAGFILMSIILIIFSRVWDIKIFAIISLILGNLSFLLYFIGSIIWYTIGNVSFSTCSGDYQSKTILRFCISSFSRLNIALIIIFGISNLIVTFFLLKRNKQILPLDPKSK